MLMACYLLCVSAGLTLLAVCIASIWRPEIAFWPPPATDTWQYTVFWLLFRVFLLGLVMVCILDFGAIGTPSTAQLALGIPLFLIGFGLAFYATFVLGWKAAHGEANGLNTSGCYQWSRNPIYVITIVGIVGLGLVVNSWLATSLLVIWTAFYIAAPFLEEPWLEQRYADEYREYASKVPRFF